MTSALVSCVVCRMRKCAIVDDSKSLDQLLCKGILIQSLKFELEPTSRSVDRICLSQNMLSNRDERNFSVSGCLSASE